MDILFLHIKILFSASENIIIVLQFFFPLKIKKREADTSVLNYHGEWLRVSFLTRTLFGWMQPFLKVYY